MRASAGMVAPVALGILMASQTDAPAQNASANCKLDAAFQAVLREVKPEEFLNEITTKCKGGDIIAFPAGHTYVMSKTCDFAQSIVYSPRQVICVYIGQVRSDR